MRRNGEHKLDDRDESDLWMVAALGMTAITAVIVGVLSYGLN